MSKDLAQRLKKLDHKADWIGLREFKETTQQCVARNGKFEQNSTTIDHGIMVEALVDGQFAYCGTADLSDKALQDACDRATRLARHMSLWKIFPFNPDHRQAATGQYYSSTHAAATGEVMGLLVDATQKMKVSDKITNCKAQALLMEREITLVSSSGSHTHQHIYSVASNLSATAQEGTESQTRTAGSPCLQGGIELLKEQTSPGEAERIGKEALELLNAEQCPTGIYDLILAPDQLYLQVHESIGHPLELDRILGDERNYAGWSFVELSDFGQLQYGSHLLNVTFDPTVEGEYASYAFDDTGLAATRQYLIKDGILLRGLGGIDSQKRAGVPGVASTRSCSWNRPPIDRMANINIEPGQSSFEDMISGVERGILMSTNASWSIDDYRNKFQFGCEYGRLIENGKLTKIVKNPNYRGITSNFWHNLKKVGDPSTFKIWGASNCGKGEPNQMIQVGHAVPLCLFENVEVFGGTS
ncbi:MAG TPA: TldD/PmbA family protein [Alphaproteobacteria bacterium]|nr:TldD/PmbA family protein [Alphaproteobacteria bacterium]